MNISAKSVIFTASLLSLPLSLSHASGAFEVDGKKILDPSGNEFVVQGTNIYTHDTQDYNSIVNCWGFNTVRVLNYPDINDPNRLSNLDSVETTFADQGIVVIMDLAHDAHYDNGVPDEDGIGRYWEGELDNNGNRIGWVPQHNGVDVTEYANFISEQHSDLENMYAYYADKYKDNPYVWLELINEPGTTGNMVDTLWIDIHQKLVKAIRDQGNDNPILVSGWCWGQDACDWTGGNVNPANSAILDLGHNIMTIDGVAQDNIIFTHHVYDQFQYGGLARMADYHTKVQDEDYALIVGEYSHSNNNSTMNATRYMFDSVQQRDIGRIVWHWESNNYDTLTVRNSDGSYGGGADINSCTSPTNLSELGQLVWDDLHD